jgi:hypothetical protein
LLIFLIFIQAHHFLGANLLVGIARENLASSVPESESERCEQFALGLQKFAPDRQLVREPEVNFQRGLAKELGKSRPIITNFRGTGV